MKKTYKKFSEAEISKLRMYWLLARDEHSRVSDRVAEIEKTMEEDLGIHNLEFFYNDGQLVGIGTFYAPDGERYELLQSEELEGE